MSNQYNDRYLLDANVFIEAAKRYYAFDLVSTFWSELGIKAQEGRILSIDRVSDELDPNNTELKRWADEDFQRFEQTSHYDVLQAYGLINRWAHNQDYKDSAKAEFSELRNADAWVISYALAKKLVIVTEERLKLDAKKRIPIPNVCKAFGIRCIDTFAMLRELEIRLS